MARLGQRAIFSRATATLVSFLYVIFAYYFPNHSPPIPHVSPPSVVLFADDIKSCKSHFKHYKSASPPTSPPPSSPPADTPSPKKKRMTAASVASRLLPLDEEDMLLAPSLQRKYPPKTPTPASRKSCNIFIDDEAEEEGDDGGDGDELAMDEDIAGEADDETENSVDDVDDAGSALGSDPEDEHHLSSVNNATSGDMSAGGDDAAVDDDTDEGDGSDDSGELSANSVIRWSKARDGPQVIRPNLQDKDLADMGVYENISPDLRALQDAVPCIRIALYLGMYAWQISLLAKRLTPAVALSPPPSPGPSSRWQQELFVDPPEKPAPAMPDKTYLYQWAQPFKAEVPIYDGHGKYGPEFLFAQEQFTALDSFPKYQGDLPADSLVAVGSTLFLSNSSSGKSLYTNVQFVILLGLPIPSSSKTPTRTKASSVAVARSKGKGKQKAR
ncbi:hypothetical protein EV421DRAFT_1904242 [Armillaria borealis]|uniref:Uncharacterized protein n=1 Tax=Armillaria borealis TaxID=47425 RepID=A0AA39JGM1_9AGAR|nr:hypothetical protein EV421DRAFT_1904242 [Armillaria borealis]